MKRSCVLLGCLLAFSAHAQSPGQPVTPRQLFPSSLLNVHAPDSDGWVVTGSARNGIAFGKRGSATNETYGAQVFIFEMSPTGTSDELVSLVRQRIATMNPAPRFEQTAADFQYTESRGYPCVDARLSFDDHAATTPTGKERLRLKVVSLYCRHPVRHELGFLAAYSVRGTTADVEIEGPARGFIEGVDVPK